MGREGAVLAAASVAIAAGCIETSSVRCANGNWCPAGTVCNDDLTCYDPIACGNGQVDQGEECDGAVVDDCVARGYDSGALTCTDTCRIDERRCVHIQSQLIPLFHGGDAIWGDGTVVIIGRSAGLDYFDGTAWGTIDLGQGALNPTSLWGTSRDDFWVGQVSGGIAHRTGGAWEYYNDVGYSLVDGLWGTGDGTVFAAHATGIGRFRGGAWHDEHLPTSDVAFHDVWGSSGDDVFAAGDGGTILHFDGEVWREHETPDRLTSLRKLWGSGPTDVYALAETALWHYDGTGWTATAPPGPSLVDIGGSAHNDVYVVGGQQMWRNDGRGWTPFATEAALSFDSIWVDSPTRVWASVSGSLTDYDEGYTGVRRYHGASYAHQLVSYDAIWAASPHQYYAAAAEDDAAVVYRVDGGVRYPGYRIAGWLTDLHGLAADDVYAAGSFGIHHFDGVEWEVETVGEHRVGRLWSAGDQMFACGSGGIGRRTGRMAWSWTPAPAAVTCWDAWAAAPADAYLVSSGQLLHWNGSALTQLTWAAEPRAVWGWAADEVYVIDGQRLLRFDGVTATAVLDLPGDRPFIHAVPIARDDVFVLSGGGDAFHHDGQRWSRVARMLGGIVATAGTPGQLFLLRGTWLTTLSRTTRWWPRSCERDRHDGVDDDGDGAIDEVDPCTAGGAP